MSAASHLLLEAVQSLAQAARELKPLALAGRFTRLHCGAGADTE